MTNSARFAMFAAALLAAGRLAAVEPPPAVLPGTAPLESHEDLSVRLVEQAHRLLDQKTAASPAGRRAFWRRDLSSPERYARSVIPNRERLKRILGVVDSRLPPAMERYGDDNLAPLVAETESYRICQVRWRVLPGVTGEGLLAEPKLPSLAHVVALPDADQTPEQLLGLSPGIPVGSQFARVLAANRFRVLVPVLISRGNDFSGNPLVKMTNQPHREWIYRQAFPLGQHVIGYEIQKVLAAVDWLQSTAQSQAKIGAAGYGEGGLIAFHAAAVDERLAACLVSGYFDRREELWQEPIERNVRGLLQEFGDAEIASLIAPRHLTVEHCRVPEVAGPPAVPPGRVGGAAPGRLRTPTAEAVTAEIARFRELTQAKFDVCVCSSGDPARADFGGEKALGDFARSLSGTSLCASAELPAERRKGFSPLARQQRQVAELEACLQRLRPDMERVRDEFRQVGNQGPEAFLREAQRRRELLYRQIIGVLGDPLVAANAKSRRVYDEPKWTGYEVLLDVLPGLEGWGILCVPKGMAPGEKRAVVVCQHGLEGVPRDVIERGIPAFSYYKAFAAQLAEQGFVTFAPFHLYRGGERFRLLQRKAHPLGLSLYSLILRQHEQWLAWLRSQPFVDSSRIAFYGLSYGGRSALIVPTVLEDYSLSICSGNFNDWLRKLTDPGFSASYMFTAEWEMYEFGLGETFNHAEMAYLMYPRPFMVERGHNDGVGLDWWVAYEFAKVRWLYASLGRQDRCEIEYFPGQHEIHGAGAFEFLRKHLAPASVK
ncbi:MAG: dienelactone hydrolase family protein [Thermoguttaceae bacterium]